MTNYDTQKVAYEKVYIAVFATYLIDGTVLPRSFEWEDGHRYKIERVVQIQVLSALRSDNRNTRYKVLIRNRERYIFFEEYNNVRRWYVERRLN